MSYQKQTTQNRSFIKRFSHTARFTIAQQFAQLQEAEKILDYGTGNGELFVVLRDIKAQQKVAFEPIAEMHHELTSHLKETRITDVSCLQSLEKVDTRFTTIFCLEVLEHFNPQQQQQHLDSMLSLLAEEGQLVISVPIEVGFASLVKNTIRFLIGQKPSLFTARNVWKAFLGQPIARPQGDYIYSHIGFNHKALENVFQQNPVHVIEKRYCTNFMAGFFYQFTGFL